MSDEVLISTVIKGDAFAAFQKSFLRKVGTPDLEVMAI